MFFEMLLNNLNTHNQVEHSINFVKEKMLRINCVYNILQDEFVAFRNYIENILKKKLNLFFQRFDRNIYFIYEKI